MGLIQMTRPVRLVTAAEAKVLGNFPASDSDQMIELLLAAAQQSIDGPFGSLGRAVAEQGLEYSISATARTDFATRIILPLPTATSIEGVEFGPPDEPTAIDPDAYELESSSVYWRRASDWPPSASLRIRYKAGWSAADVPDTIKCAIVMIASQLKAGGAAFGALRRETLDDIGSWDFVLPEAAGEAARKAADTLLRPFKVHVLR